MNGQEEVRRMKGWKSNEYLPPHFLLFLPFST